VDSVLGHQSRRVRRRGKSLDPAGPDATALIVRQVHEVENLARGRIEVRRDINFSPAVVMFSDGKKNGFAARRPR
jgi:hypothetical protein